MAKLSKKQNIIAVSIVVALGLAMYFAIDKWGRPTAGELKDFDGVCDRDKNNGKRVAVEGYLRLPKSILGPKSQAVVLSLYKGPDFSSEPIEVPMKFLGQSNEFGGQANELESLPTEYDQEDLKVHLATGQVAGFGTKVRVSGQVDMDSVPKCRLLNPLVELAK